MQPTRRINWWTTCKQSHVLLQHICQMELWFCLIFTAINPVSVEWPMSQPAKDIGTMGFLFAVEHDWSGEWFKSLCAVTGRGTICISTLNSLGDPRLPVQKLPVSVCVPTTRRNYGQPVSWWCISPIPDSIHSPTAYCDELTSHNITFEKTPVQWQMLSREITILKLFLFILGLLTSTDWLTCATFLFYFAGCFFLLLLWMCIHIFKPVIAIAQQEDTNVLNWTEVNCPHSSFLWHMSLLVKKCCCFLLHLVTF